MLSSGVRSSGKTPISRILYSIFGTAIKQKKKKLINKIKVNKLKKYLN